MFRRHTAALMILLSAAGAVAQRVGPRSEEVPAQGLDISSVASLILGLVFLTIVVLVVIFVRRRLEEQRVREAMAEAAFEMEVLASIRGAEEMPALAPQGAYAAVEAESPVSVESALLPPEEPRPVAQPAPAPSGYLLSAGDQQPEKADVAAAGVLSQLRHAGLLNDLDGYMELNGNPQGAAILRMKDGRRALLVPYHETEAFTRRNLRRFDLLIFVGRDGKAVVVNSLENVIAERVASRF